MRPMLDAAQRHSSQYMEAPGPVNQSLEKRRTGCACSTEVQRHVFANSILASNVGSCDTPSRNRCLSGGCQMSKMSLYMQQFSRSRVDKALRMR